MLPKFDDWITHVFDHPVASNTFSPSCSNFMFSVCKETVSTEAKIDIIKSIETLYRKCLSVRCTQTLGSLEEEGGSALNSICYMLWDDCPIASLVSEAKTAEVIFDAFLDSTPLDPDLKQYAVNARAGAVQ